jgi:hypothetical protein
MSLILPSFFYYKSVYNGFGGNELHSKKNQAASHFCEAGLGFRVKKRSFVGIRSFST